jgi:hypothetical protein
LSGAEGVFADLAPIALPFTIMDGNVALSHLAGCPNTSGSGKMTVTCPSAFVYRFAETHLADGFRFFQGFPPKYT